LLLSLSLFPLSLLLPLSLVVAKAKEAATLGASSAATKSNPYVVVLLVNC
jgi:hypothetical protein